MRENKNRSVFALRGVLDGQFCCFPLRSGGNRVGSDPASDLCLPVAGVSKRHALVSFINQRVFVEDLASKNGTFFNDLRLASAEIELGDRLQIGPVELVLEEIEMEESQLAVDLGKSDQLDLGTLNGETATYQAASSEGSLSTVELLGVFVDRLEHGSLSNPFASALSLLVHEMTLVGLCLFEVVGHSEPVLRSAAGRFESLETEFLADVLEQRGHKTELEINLPSEQSGRSAVPGLLVFSKSADLGLIAWGGGVKGAERRALLQTVLKILCLRDQAQAQRTPQRSLRIPKLVWPTGYVPGESSAMVEFYRQLQPIVHTDLPVLVLGETGTGKESVAQILHASSKRRGGPLVAVNCAAIPADLLEAEIFGIGSGVATGVAGRSGRFQEAHGGTLLLDEIGDMPLELQAKLLRVLEDRQIRPVGKKPVTIDVRVVSATNSDLNARIEEGRFRPDLFYRLAGLVLHLPPLRHRREDIPQLVAHFLRNASQQAGKDIRGVTVGAMRQLVQRHWPGNVRELKHQIRRLVYQCPNHQIIDSSMVEMPSDPVVSMDADSTSQLDDRPSDLNLRTVEDINLAVLEKQAVLEALRRSGGQLTHAASLLGVTRQTLRRRIERHHLK